MKFPNPKVRAVVTLPNGRPVCAALFVNVLGRPVIYIGNPKAAREAGLDAGERRNEDALIQVSVNYKKGNQSEWRKWNQVPDRNSADTAVYYEQLRDFIRRVKADPRFRFTDLSRFLPPVVQVGSVTIGPADFLMAALDVLVTGAETVTVLPKDQLGSFKLISQFETYRMANTWVHTPEFKDAYLTDRLRLQLWTMRVEDDLASCAKAAEKGGIR